MTDKQTAGVFVAGWVAIAFVAMWGFRYDRLDLEFLLLLAMFNGVPTLRTGYLALQHFRGKWSFAVEKDFDEGALTILVLAEFATVAVGYDNGGSNSLAVLALRGGLCAAAWLLLRSTWRRFVDLQERAGMHVSLSVDGSQAYVSLPGHLQGQSGTVQRTESLENLTKPFRGPRVYFDFRDGDELIGIEIVNVARPVVQGSPSTPGLLDE